MNAAFMRLERHERGIHVVTALHQTGASRFRLSSAVASWSPGTRSGGRLVLTVRYAS